MFSHCLLISSLPDISKWNTNKIVDVSGLFYECRTLTSLPDILKWNTNNVKKSIFMFKHCYNLKCKNKYKSKFNL